MTAPWPLTQPHLVDRAAHRRELSMDHADAIVVRDGAVLAADGRLIELPPQARPAASLVAYLGSDSGRDLVVVVPADANFGNADDGIGADRMVGLRDLLHAFAERGKD